MSVGEPHQVDLHEVACLVEQVLIYLVQSALINVALHLGGHLLVEGAFASRLDDQGLDQHPDAEATNHVKEVVVVGQLCANIGVKLDTTEFTIFEKIVLFQLVVILVPNKFEFI